MCIRDSLQRLQFLYTSLLDSPKSIIIFSDSQSVLLALQNTFLNPSTSPLLLQILDVCSLLQIFHYIITLHWLPAHAGIPPNEAVDALAKSASILPPPPLPMPISDLLSTTKKSRFLTWSTLWQSSKFSSHYSSTQPFLPSVPWFSPFSLLSRFICTINRLRSGHCRSPAFLHKINLLPSPYCPYHSSPLSEGDLNHIFFSCPVNSSESAKLSLELIKLGYLPPFHVTNRLSLIHI